MRGANKITTARARSLRQSDNEAEWAFWLEVRNRRLNGMKFVRQEPIGPYFADFACRDHRLIVELDGSQHVGTNRDVRRNAFMNDRGWSVARFWSNDFLANLVSVMETVLAVCDGRITDRVESADFRFFPVARPDDRR